MIMLLTGENSFEIERHVRELAAAFDGDTEQLEAENLTLDGLYDALTGQSLFSDARLVTVKQLSENTALWEKLPDVLARMGKDGELILIESKPDKRTRTYKSLLKTAQVTEFPAWSNRDRQKAVEWVRAEAKQQELELTPQLASRLVDRVGFDQWQLFHAIEKLAVCESVTTEIIDETIDARPSENVFQLFETALRGDRDRLAMMLRTLEQTEEPYRVFGLLGSQVYQLVALSASDEPPSHVARDIGAMPSILTKLQPYAKDLSAIQCRKLVTLFVETDDDMKSSGGDPWLLIERCLFGVAVI